MHWVRWLSYHVYVYSLGFPYGLWSLGFLLKSVCARREGGQSWVCAPTLMLQHIYAQKGSIMKSHHVWVSIRICFGKYIHTFREMANHWQFIRESLSDGHNECVAHTYFYRHTHTHRLEHALNIRNIIPLMLKRQRTVRRAVLFTLMASIGVHWCLCFPCCWKFALHQHQRDENGALVWMRGA